jgi:hypothetical protein
MARLDAPVFTGGGRLQDEKLGCLDIEFTILSGMGDMLHDRLLFGKPNKAVTSDE